MKRKLSLLLTLAIITSIFFQNPLILYASQSGLGGIDTNKKDILSEEVEEKEGIEEEKRGEGVTEPGNVSVSKVIIDQIDDMEYTGKAVKPSLTLSYEDLMLEEDADYTLEYKDNINTGIATIVITGIGSFTDSTEVNFNIKPMPVSKLTLRKLSSKLFTGNAITQNIVLKNGDTVLTEGADYTISYSDNIKMSNLAKVVITGMGNYSESRTDTFSIVSPGMYATIFEGEGTEDNPYLISTPEDLKKLADKVNSEVYGQTYSFKGKYFILTNDIDISCYENWTPIGGMGEFNTHSAFFGTFNGQGYTISGLNINKTTSTSDYLDIYMAL